MKPGASKLAWALGGALLTAGVLLSGALRVPLSAAFAQKPELSPSLPVEKRVFPPDNPWNEDISHFPVDPKSDALIAEIGRDKPLHPDFGGEWKGAPVGIPYVVVPGAQPRQPVQFDYADESDPGSYPIPPHPPIEGGGREEGDRHLLIVDRDHWKLYELFALRLEGGLWRAGSGAVYDLNANSLRPAGWTSADAAGLPIFPGLVRYEEAVVKKEIAHALRFTVRKSRKAYVYPARHWASRSLDPSLPPMGMRVRLKAGVDLASFPQTAQVILKALKKYGMLLADNGADWFVSGAPDSRWKTEELALLKRIKGSDFEVVLMTNPVVSDR